MRKIIKSSEPEMIRTMRNESTGAEKVKRILTAAVLALAMLAGGATAYANIVEWDSVNGGGTGGMTGGGNLLSGTIGQTAVDASSPAADDLKDGYRVALPLAASVECRNGGAVCTGVCYGEADQTFTFYNTMGGGSVGSPSSFHSGATQYYLYLWQANNTYTYNSILGGNDWSDTAAMCEGGACDSSGTSMTLVPTSTSNTWYFIAKSFNGGQCATGAGSCEGLTAYNTVEIGPIQYDEDAADPGSIGAVAVSNQANGTHVDGDGFDIDVSGIVTQGCSALTGCEYCATNDGDCTGDWAVAGYGAGACSQNTVTCTDGDTITINMRAIDGVSNTTEANGGAISRTCDRIGPTVTQVLPDSDSYTNTTDITGGAVTCNDGTGVGLHATPYDVMYCKSNSAKTDCDDAGGTWSDETTVGYTGTDDQTITNADDGYYYCFRAKCRDAFGHESTWMYSMDAPAGCIFVDRQAPPNPSVTGYDDSNKGVTLMSGNGYPYDEPSGPYFEWNDPTDNPSSPDNSGIKGYYVYFGTNSSADPANYQAAAAPNTFTNSTSLVNGTTYYLRMKTEDNAGNISSAETVFVYTFTSGAYLRATAVDDDATSYGGDLGTADGSASAASTTLLDGVLNPDGSEFEIVLIQLYDEADAMISNGTLATSTVEISLGSDGTSLADSGAYIDSTGLTGAGATGPGTTSVTGNLVAGEGWVKIKATAAASEAIYVEADQSGASSFSGSGGRNQRAFVLVREPTGFGEEVETVTDMMSPIAGGTVMHPVWSKAGTEVVVAARTAAATGWNLWLIDWNGSGWDAAIRLTNDGMCVQPQARYSFNSDDSKVIFASKENCSTASPGLPEMYAVDADGSDSGDTLADLQSEDKHISNGAGTDFWWDSHWNVNAGPYADQLLVSKASNYDVELYFMNGVKTNGLYREGTGGTTYTKITNFGGRETWTFHGSTSADGTKVTFVVWEGYSASPTTSIYSVDLTTAALPVSGVAAGVELVHSCTMSSCPNGAGLYPSYTNDGTMVSYMADDLVGSTFDIENLIIYSSTHDSLVTNFFTGANFDNYVEYLGDGIFCPQLLGQSENNEFGLVQCHGAGCPQSTNGNLFSYVTLQPGTTDGKLKFLELSDVSSVSSNGGLLFFQGAVSAVIPPGAILGDEVKLQVTAPVAAPGTPDGEDVLVSTGEAREFFPDGIKFDKDILMVFHYCDSDGDGMLDTNQDAACTGGGNTAIDENDLYVYFWCEDSTLGCTQDAWNKLDGSVDPTTNAITVAINHFSKYDVWALMKGRFAPQVHTPLNLVNLHTYPNPWRTGYGRVEFTAAYTTAEDPGAANPSSYNQNDITVSVSIYDIRGKLVRTINEFWPTTIPGNTAGTGLMIADWDVTNNAGRQVASGIYPYVLRINDGLFSKTYTGKLTVVR